MFEESANRICGKSGIAILIVLSASNPLLADNRLTLKKVTDNAIVIELSNTDSIAGFQFSINARGGIGLQTFEGIERTIGARLTVFQYLKDASTLNVVLLAPYRSSLSAGQGGIGKVSFVLTSVGSSDSASVFLTNVKICDADARILDVTSEQLCWSLRQSNEDTSFVFDLEQNYPNPFNPSTAISYQLSAIGKVSLKIYNMLGQEVASLVDGDRLAGYHQEMWDATRYSSGVYVYQLIATDEHGAKQVARKRMLLLK